jgi:hypothetical protein
MAEEPLDRILVLQGQLIRKIAATLRVRGPRVRAAFAARDADGRWLQSRGAPRTMAPAITQCLAILMFCDAAIPEPRLVNISRNRFCVAPRPVTVDGIWHGLELCFRPRKKYQGLDKLQRLARLQFVTDCDSRTIRARPSN